MVVIPFVCVMSTIDHMTKRNTTLELLLKELHQYKNILWDWNGTLLDDVQISYGIVAEQMAEYGLKPLSPEELKDYFCFPIKKYYDDLGFPTDDESFKKIADHFMATYIKRQLEQAEVFSGTRELLSELTGKQQFIISASEEGLLKDQLSSFQLSNFFKKIYGLSDSYGVSKYERCAYLLKENGLDPKETVLVGDTSHDAEVAQKSGIKLQLVADGFQKYSKLRTYCPKTLETRYFTS